MAVQPQGKKGLLLTSVDETGVNSTDSAPQWNERWVTLRGTRILCRATSEESSDVILTGVVKAVRKTSFEVVDHSRGFDYHHFFSLELVSQQQQLLLGAPNEKELISWLSSLEAAIIVASQPLFPADSDSTTQQTPPIPIRTTNKLQVLAASPPGSPATTSPIQAPAQPPQTPAQQPLSTSTSTRKMAKNEWDKKRRESLYGGIVVKRGWLKVRGVMKQWALRLFVLKAGVLLYFKDEQDEAQDDALGIINLKGCLVAQRESKKDGFCFKIWHPKNHAIYNSRGLKGEILASGKLPVGDDEAILRVTTTEEGREWIKEIEISIDLANKMNIEPQSQSQSQLNLPDTISINTPNNNNNNNSPSTPTLTRHGSASNSQLPPPTNTSIIIQKPPPAISTDSTTTTTTTTTPIPIPIINHQQTQQTPNQSPTQQINLPPQPISKAPIPPTIESIDQSSSSSSSSQQQQNTNTNTTVEIIQQNPNQQAIEAMPSRYIPEIPKPEMKIDAFEAGKSILLQMAKQLRPGMDLTKVVLPTHILEPRSFLEKTTDYFAHIELISEAIHEPDPVKRILKLSKWYISGFYIMPKTVKKPYNPILGETYRCMWDHGNSKSFLVCEQVSHHPPISAFYAENRQDGWIVNGAILFKSKFWGMSVGSLLEGHATMYLPLLDEEYTITFPSAIAKGFFIGPLTMEMFGKVVLDCKKTGLTSTIEFKVKPAFRGEFNCVGGQIERSDGQILYTFDGRYDREITVTDSQTKESQSLWKITPETPLHRIQRNVIPFEEQDKFESEKLWAKVTKALIDGDQNAATEAKSELETEQRNSCKKRDETGVKWITKYFDFNENDNQWVYKWIKKNKWDPKREIDEYESNGRIYQIIRSDAPILPAPSTTTTTSSSSTASTSNQQIPLSVEPIVSENGPLLIQEVEKMKVIVAKMKEELTSEKEKTESLSAQLEQVLSALKHMTAISTASSIPNKQQQRQHNEGVSNIVAFSFAVLMLLAVLLIFRKISAIESSFPLH